MFSMRVSAVGTILCRVNERSVGADTACTLRHDKCQVVEKSRLVRRYNYSQRRRSEVGGVARFSVQETIVGPNRTLFQISAITSLVCCARRQ